MKLNLHLVIAASCLLMLLFFTKSFAQESEEGEKIVYYQMEPLDDSLFIKIQKELFIQPPDPKAEIIVDLRDPNNQTISVKGTLYPFLALDPVTRAKVITYPFKINLEENINFGSVFTRVLSKIRFKDLLKPPSLYQISSTLGYINPFLQMFGGERFGIPIKKDIGISFGLGTPYSGPLETNFVEADFHILGFYGGFYSNVDAFTQVKRNNNWNNLYATEGIQVGYVIPLGNFFEVSYLKSLLKPTADNLTYFHRYNVKGYTAKVIDGAYYDWEFRYPLQVLGSTRAKVYFARYLNELHVGFTGRELSIAGSTFDFRFDGLLQSDVRQPQYVFDLMVQRIGESWAFSSFALGPSVVFGNDTHGRFGVITLFFNMRLKVGTSL